MKRSASGYCFSSVQLCASARSVCLSPEGALPAAGGSGTQAVSAAAAALHQSATDRNDIFTPGSPKRAIRTMSRASSAPPPR